MGTFVVRFGVLSQKNMTGIMCYAINGTSWGRKIQATPTKQDLGTFEGFFSKLSMSTPVVVIRESPCPLGQDWRKLFVQDNLPSYITLTTNAFNIDCYNYRRNTSSKQH